MRTDILWIPVKLMGILFILMLLILIPVCAVFAPIAYIGSLFGNTFGTIEGNFNGTYTGNFTEELDAYVFDNRVSVDYNALTGCVLYDMKDDPAECLGRIDADTGRMDKRYEQLLTLPEKEYIGSYDDSYFEKIHVLGKYTVSKYEKVGEHEETKPIEQNGSGPYTGPEYETVIVDDYDWVYYPEIRRGKCISSDTVACNIILEDRDVYPYQSISFNLSDHYGIHVDPESYEITMENYQSWSGDILYAFSKGTVLSSSNKEILLKILANNIDLYARYVSDDGLLFPEFSHGETVEATEIIGYSEGEIKLYLYNSINEYVNPALFVSPGDVFTGLGNGTVIYGMEDFAPNFSDTRVWYGTDDGGINPYGNNHMGQCTWFCWGLFYQHYGFDPGFRNQGSLCAYQTYRNLKEKGWTYSRSPSPGAVFSTTNFEHTGIVAGVIDEDTMVIVEGNFNHRNDSFEQFIRIPDWSMRTVSTHYYKAGVGFVFANPPTN